MGHRVFFTLPLALILIGCGTTGAAQPTSLAPTASAAQTASPSPTPTPALESTTWRSLPVPTPGVTLALLNSLGCDSMMDCWTFGNAGFAENFTGGAWHPSFPLGKSVLVGGVTCPAPGDCWAVGAGSNEQALVAHYSAGRWAQVSTPYVPSTTQGVSLQGISCTSESSCWAVGSGNQAPVIESYQGGQWTVANSPSVPGSSEGQLFAISCVASDDCWAVGEIVPGQALIEHFDGTSWSITPVASVDGARLNGVTCTSSDNCWAVGNVATLSGGAPPPKFIIEHYNGAAWTEYPISTPTGLFTLAQLSSVACPSSQDCWAVGDTVVEHFNGTVWTRLDEAIFALADMVAVSCANPADCLTVGGKLPNDAAFSATTIAP